MSNHQLEQSSESSSKAASETAVKAATAIAAAPHPDPAPAPSGTRTKAKLEKAIASAFRHAPEVEFEKLAASSRFNGIASKTSTNSSEDVFVINALKTKPNQKQTALSLLKLRLAAADSHVLDEFERNCSNVNVINYTDMTKKAKCKCKKPTDSDIVFGDAKVKPRNFLCHWDNSRLNWLVELEHRQELRTHEIGLKRTRSSHAKPITVAHSKQYEELPYKSFDENSVVSLYICCVRCKKAFFPRLGY